MKTTWTILLCIALLPAAGCCCCPTGEPPVYDVEPPTVEEAPVGAPDDPIQNGDPLPDDPQGADDAADEFDAS